MNKVEVNIQLDPVNDGAVFHPEKMQVKEFGALIIGTNGESKFISEEEALDIMDNLTGKMRGEYMGRSVYMVVLNDEKIYLIGGQEYFIGSALIIKSTREGLSMLEGEDFEKAANIFESRLVTLVGDGQEFSAYELN